MSQIEWSIIIRLVVAVAVGGVIGWNRQIGGKPAGLRTHMLVSLASALIVSIPAQINPAHAFDGISRAIQGVATGVGFLGAGEILYKEPLRGDDSPKVKGLTSAAALWTTAALGLVCGCGLWLTALTGTVLVLMVLTIAKWIERFIVVHRD